MIHNEMDLMDEPKQEKNYSLQEDQKVRNCFKIISQKM